MGLMVSLSAMQKYCICEQMCHYCYVIMNFNEFPLQILVNLCLDSDSDILDQTPMTEVSELVPEFEIIKQASVDAELKSSDTLSQPVMEVSTTLLKYSKIMFKYFRLSYDVFIPHMWYKRNIIDEN